MKKENKSTNTKNKAMETLRHLLNNAHFGQVYDYQLSEFVDTIITLIKEETLSKKE